MPYEQRNPVFATTGDFGNTSFSNGPFYSSPYSKTPAYGYELQREFRPTSTNNAFIPSEKFALGATAKEPSPFRQDVKETQPIPSNDVVEPSHPVHHINPKTHSDFIDYRHYPPYELQPGLGPARWGGEYPRDYVRPDYLTYPDTRLRDTYRINPYSFELKVENPEDAAKLRSIYKETRFSPGSNAIRENPHPPLPGDPIQTTPMSELEKDIARGRTPPKNWELLDDRLQSRLPRYPNTREYMSSYLGPEYVDYRHHLARYPSLIDDVDYKTYYHRMYEDLSMLLFKQEISII
jgi:hypothetical protein